MLGTYNRNVDREIDLSLKYKSMGQLLEEIHNGLENSMYTNYLSAQCLPLPSLLLALNRTYVEVVILDMEGKMFNCFLCRKKSRI